MKISTPWLCLALGVWACDPPIDTKLKLINASDEPILIFCTVDGRNYAVNGLSAYNPFQEIQQANTTRGYQIGLMKDNPNYIVSGDTLSAHMGPGKWESHIGNGKLWVYVFKPETVLTNDWDSIRMGQKWSKVYSVTLDEVEVRKWIISL